VSLLVATGLRAEARVLAGPGVRTVAGGGRSAALEAALAAAAPKASAIISIGLGGGLVGDLRPGDWVVAEAVIEGTAETPPQSASLTAPPQAVEHLDAKILHREAGEVDPAEGGRRRGRSAHAITLPTDAAWTRALTERLPGARRGVLLGSDAMLTAVAEKARARVEWGALAVDMESHVAARVARRFGLRFAAARVISDGADRALPAAVRAALRDDGGMDAGAVVAALARDPLQIPALIRTGWEAARAMRSLAEGRRLLGPGLGLANLLELPLDMA